MALRFDPARSSAFVLVLSALSLAGCGGGGGASRAVPAVAGMPQAPKSVSPASVYAPPMAQTAIQPPSTMSSRKPHGDIQQLGWTQLTGAAVFVTASPDGSIWVLSPEGPPGGRDKYIYHYVNGTWTNVPGWAVRLAVGPDGTLWAVNSAGGIYAYNGSWRTLAGGASDISVGPDGSVYVISDAPGGPDGRGIWHYVNGSWSQLPGAAVRIAASSDTGTYPGGIGPGGFYVTNAYGSIYYFNPTSGYHQVSGGAAEVQPTKSGGLFALGAPPARTSGNPIYYNNVANGSWSLQPGAGVSLATDGAHLYAVGPEGGIYSTPVTGTGPGSGSAAPVVGYLAQTPTGSFAGVLDNVGSSATVVGVSTNEISGGPSASLSLGLLAFNVGGTALSSTQRQAASAARPAALSGPIGRRERAVEGPAQIDALIARLRPSASTGARGTQSSRRTSALASNVGAVNSFWVTVAAIGTSNGTDVQVPATLRAVANNGYVWIDNTLALDSGTIAKIAADLDNAYTSDSAHYGSPGFTASAPGIANHGRYRVCDAAGTQVAGSAPSFVVPPDSKVNVLVLNENSLGAGVGGYFASVNYFAQAALNCLIGQNGYTALTVPHSNEAPLFYVGWNGASSTAYNTDEDLVRGTAHELQHLINFVHHQIVSDGSGEDSWINEGMSMLAQDLAVTQKYGVAHDFDALYHAQAFLNAPQNFSLTAFTGIDGGQGSPQFNCSGCYGEEYLFQRYLYDRFGGDAYLHAMLGYNTRHWALESATGTKESQLISDFAVALAASGTNKTGDARFGIGSLNVRAPYTDQFGRTLTLGAPAAGTLPSSATPYLGSFVYYGVGPSANGQTLSAKDVAGSFGLQVGVVQQ